MAKQERASRTHERFLDASADEFSRHGYAGANLQRIAAHVGMTKGALYAHFPSKGALAAEFTSSFDQVGHKLLQEIGEGDPPLTSLRHVTVGFVHRMQSDLRFRAGLRLTFEEACSQGRVPAVITELSAALTRLIGDAQDNDELTTRQRPELISSLVVTLMCGMHYIAPLPAPANGLGDNTEQVCQIWQLLSSRDMA